MCKIELNKIYNMDCMKGLDIIPDNSIDLIIIDPPYQLQTLRENEKDKYLYLVFPKTNISSA